MLKRGKKPLNLHVIANALIYNQRRRTISGGLRRIVLVDVAVSQRRPGGKQALEMREYGKHGLPRSRLPILPTLF